MGLSQSKVDSTFTKFKKYDSKGGMKHQIFKPYEQNQGMLLPPSREELIPPNYMVRVVDEIVE
jgi:hypothetical protein